jgi:TM2 domain-containing membrane protein YozV
MQQRTCSSCGTVYDSRYQGLRFCGCGQQLSQPARTRVAEKRPAPGPLIIPAGPTPSHTPRPRDEHAPTPTHAPPDPRYLPLPGQRKSPPLAALLSFLLVGMGQVYLGQVEKGLTMLGVVLLLLLTVVLGPLGFLLLLLNVSDAFLLARKVNRGRPIRKWEFFFNGDRVSGRAA